MENSDNVNNESNQNKDPNVTMEKSWVFIDKVALEEDGNEELKHGYIFKDKVNAVEILSEDSVGSPDENSDSDGISIISEIDDLQSYKECSMCASTHSDIIVTNNDSSEYENVSNTSMLSNCTDVSENLEHNYKNDSRKNKVIFFTTVTGLSLVATYLFLTDNSINTPALPVDDAADNYDDSNIIFNIKSDYYKIPNIRRKINEPLCKFKFSNTTLSSMNDLKSTTRNKDMPTHISKPQSNKQVDNFCRINNQDNIPKRKFTLDSNVKINKDKRKDNNRQKIVKEYTNKIKLDKFEMKEEILLKKYKALERKEKYLNKLEKNIRKMEVKLRKMYVRVKKEIGKDERKRKDRKNGDGKFKKTAQSNITGEWYVKMYKGRSAMRSKEKKSDWMFDRSNMRSQLRNKGISLYNEKPRNRRNFKKISKLFVKQFNL